MLRSWIRPHFVGPWRHARVRRVDVVDGAEVVDDGTLVVFRAPRSSTGEDVAELTLHGNPYLVERALDLAVRAGARIARPGEFTRRAVLRGKADVLQAERTLAVSEALSVEGLRVARELDSGFRSAIGALREELLVVAAELEARLDQGHDELVHEGDAQLERRLRLVQRRASGLAGTWSAGRALIHGARVALIGEVNAGKSSLFNALCGSTRALVHPTPGTTRDIVEAQVLIEGVPVTLADTAGERLTSDPVEAAGLALARAWTDEADLVLVVLRARSGGLTPGERAILDRTEERRRVIVYNGVDLPEHAPAPPGAVPTVATQGSGLVELRDSLRRTLLGAELPDGIAVTSLRQRDLLVAIAEGASRVPALLADAGPAVAAEEVVEVVSAIDALTGEDTREAVLDALFARFCIGK